MRRTFWQSQQKNITLHNRCWQTGKNKNSRVFCRINHLAANMKYSIRNDHCAQKHFSVNHSPIILHACTQAHTDWKEENKNTFFNDEGKEMKQITVSKKSCMPIAHYYASSWSICQVHCRTYVLSTIWKNRSIEKLLELAEWSHYSNKKNFFQTL